MGPHSDTFTIAFAAQLPGSITVTGDRACTLLPTASSCGTHPTYSGQ